MIDFTQVRQYYIACGYTDLRRGIDGLAAIVSNQFQRSLDEESLFLFCGRRTDRIKALYFSGDSYILLYKRLTNGNFQWPRSEEELRQLDTQSLHIPPATGHVHAHSRPPSCKEGHYGLQEGFLL